MKANEAVRKVMEVQGVGATQVANRLGKTPRLVCDRLAMENISIEKLNDLLRVLDYKVVVVPKSSRVPDGGYEIE